MASARTAPAAGDGGVGELSSAKGREAYRAIEEAIRSGHYAAGERLKEVELAAQLDMSRTPIREAIRRLERGGLVEILPGRGAAVRAWTPDDVEDAYSLRAVLEGFSASRAALRMDAGRVARLEQLNGELERRSRDADPDADALIGLNTSFHRLILGASANRRIADVLPEATEVPLPMKRAFWGSARAREAALMYHREIAAAIGARDAVRAEAVMRSHVFAAKDFYTDHQRAARIQRLVDGGG